MTKRQSETVKLIIKGSILPVLATGLVLFYNNLEKTPLVDEHFTKGLSKSILSGIAHLTALVPFSLAELIAVLLVLSLLISLIRLASATIRGTGILQAVFRITNLIAVLIICFLLFWGFNYRQIGIEHALGISPQPIPVEDLESMADELVLQAKAERAETGFDDKTVFHLSGDLSDKANAAYRKLSAEYPQFSNPAGRAKPLMSSKLFSYMGISGIFFPFTAEANYNNDQEDLLKASSVLHELAHLKGVAREEEANFIAYLASRYSDDPAFRYSGTMLALINTTNRLSGIDPAAFERVNALYSDGIRLDLTAHNKYWKGFEGEVRQKAEDVNDQYLKSNGQAAGIESYEDMVSYLYAFRQMGGSVNLNSN